MMDCIFCKIIKGELPSEKVYEDESALAILDINPVNPGHTLVLPKRHFSNLMETPEETLKSLIVVVKKVGSMIEKGLKAEGFNVGVNNGRVAGQLIDHTHFHVMPRTAIDQWKLWIGKPYPPGEAKRVGELLRNAAREV